MKTTSRVLLHEPHNKQRAIKWALKHGGTKRLVVVTGRRAGKTTGVSDIAVEMALKGRRVLEAAPTADQTTTFWELCKRAFAQPIEEGWVYKNESHRLLVLPKQMGGGRIRCKTAFDADTLRGDYADLLILDEYSLMKPSTWNEVGAPMLLDNNGDAVFIFTPKRKNHAYHLYMRGMQDQSRRWRSFHFTSYDNPHLSRKALEEMVEDMTEDAYKQEIMAEFLDNEGAVFRNIRQCLYEAHQSQRHPSHHKIVAGVDWGKQADYTAISVFCADCGKELDKDRFHKIDYHFQRQRLLTLVQKWGVGRIVPETNAMGQAIIDEMLHDPAFSGVEFVPFTTTASSKPPLIESLVLAFEREEADWIKDDIWTAELEAYERKLSPTTNRSTYSAPEGVHDDTVIARALAWFGATVQFERDEIVHLADPVIISPV